MRDLHVAFQPDEEWYFTLFVKAAEWRNPALLSDTTPPLLPGRPPHLTAYVPNPIPAPPPVFIPATILWAALPDARGVSRYRLAFDRVPNATGGYAVFQAFEAKLRDQADLPVRTDTDLIARATDLRDLAMPLERCVDAFTRLNAKLIPPPAPGRAGGVRGGDPRHAGWHPGLRGGIGHTRAGGFGVVLAVAVCGGAAPRCSCYAAAVAGAAQRHRQTDLHVPESPATRARGNLARPARVRRARGRHHGPAAARERRRRMAAARRPGRAGRQRGRQPASSAFRSTTRRRRRGSRTCTVRLRLARATTTNGFLPGRSPQSNLVQIERLPTTLPEMLEAAGEQTDAQTVRLHFRSDALVEATPHGSFRLEIFAWDAAAAADLTETPALSLLLPSASPRPAGGNLATGTLYYGAPDATGRRTFEALFDVTGGHISASRSA